MFTDWKEASCSIWNCCFNPILPGGGGGGGKAESARADFNFRELPWYYFSSLISEIFVKTQNFDSYYDIMM